MKKRRRKEESPADWSWGRWFDADGPLRTCSLQARALWVDLLGAMRAPPVRGVLLREDGEPQSTEQIAHRAGISPQEAEALLAELEANAAISRRPEDKALIDRPTYEAELFRLKMVELGSRGGRKSRPAGHPDKAGQMRELP